MLDTSDPTNPLAIDGVNCQLGNVPSYYVCAPPCACFERSANKVCFADRSEVGQGRAGRPRVLKIDWHAFVSQEQGSRLQGSFEWEEHAQPLGASSFVIRDGVSLIVVHGTGDELEIGLYNPPSARTSPLNVIYRYRTTRPSSPKDARARRTTPSRPV